MTKLKTALLAIFAGIALSSCINSSTSRPQPADFESISIKGELSARIHKNFDRLEEDMYQPDSIFKSQLAESWPGDAQGRVVLGLVVDSRASGREPLYLEQILEAYPSEMNEQGYFGPVFDGTINEQQLSGNGWVLRGLCEYYEWTGDEKALKMISNIVDNLFMKGKGMYSSYPIDPAGRKKNLGDAIGEIVYNEDRWILSSDIGCIFIGMEGLIHAYKILGREDMKEVIEELIDRFLEIDLVAIRAQTHASLTACRGLIRYAEITGRRELIDEAAKRWELYLRYGMTENYENYNWFERYNTWSEPCAVVDSYMVAMQLWKHTGKPEYIDQAELIYYNGLCHSQRWNGGFGCDFGPGEARHTHDISVRTDEAHWCCTMRGAEGLASAAAYSYFTEGNTLYIPFFHESELRIPMGNSELSLSQHTEYPFGESVQFEVNAAPKQAVSMRLHLPVNSTGHRLTLNGEECSFEKEGGFAVLERKFRAGDKLVWSFTMEDKTEIQAVNIDNSPEGAERIFHGVLLMGKEEGSEELSPLYHLMSPEVWRSEGYSKQMLF